jgi:hypothetical protein
MILTATKRVDLTAPELLDDPYPIYARLHLVDQTPRWRPTFTVRALEALHVAP